MKIKSLLVSQPEPENPKSPYHELARKHKLKIDFRSLIQVDGLSGKEFRKQRINILDFTAVIFTSKTAVDHYFRLSRELRLIIPESMKYFCVTKNVAHYLQKYILYRKRKIFHGAGKFKDLVIIIRKHKANKFFIPLSIPHSTEIPELLDKYDIVYKIGNMYKTVSANLSDLADVSYDILVFYSPSGPKSLMENFPEFEQNSTIIAAFGLATAEALNSYNLKCDITAPTKNAPSMTMALESFIIESRKAK